MRRRLLGLCLLAFPRRVRRTEGPVLLDLADDLVEHGASPVLECLSLVRSGVAGRLGVSGVPVRPALDRLALPLAGFLLAAFVLRWLAFLPPGEAWPGWSLALAVGGSLAALIGLMLRRRLPALLAVLPLAACFVDAWRDLYSNGGSRWVTASVNVLPALAPTAAIVVAAALAVRAGPPATRAAAWTVAGAAALVLVALLIRGSTAPGTSVLAAGGALALALIGAGLRDRSARLSAALAIVMAGPAFAWIATGWLGVADWMLYVGLYGGWTALALAALALARHAAR
jgi:hypothetical protein